MSFLPLSEGGWDTLWDADGKMLFEYQMKKDVFENVSASACAGWP